MLGAGTTGGAAGEGSRCTRMDRSGWEPTEGDMATGVEVGWVAEEEGSLR